MTRSGEEVLMVSAGPWPSTRDVRTLAQAHEAVVPLRPTRNASRSAWLDFYRRSAALYRDVAEVDQAHQQHARYWANRELAKAEDLAAQSGKPSRRGGAADADAIPATLEQAHDALKAARPDGAASATRWLTYHQHAAEVYGEVAEVDRRHHHEALAFAAREREKAVELAHQIEGR